MELVTDVQIIHENIYVSLLANELGEGMNTLSFNDNW